MHKSVECVLGNLGNLKRMKRCPHNDPEDPQGMNTRALRNALWKQWFTRLFQISRTPTTTTNLLYSIEIVSISTMRGTA